MANIIIKDKTGKILNEFPANLWIKLISQLREQQVEVHSACNTWMCWACMFKIESWWENVIKNLKWEPAFPLWEEEVMSCIAWIKDDKTDVVLQNIY